MSESSPKSDGAGAEPIVDHYVHHLAAVNESSAVVATQDIFNSRGVLLVPKGSPINSANAAKLIRHRLVEPLERQVQLERALTREALQGEFGGLFKTFEDARELHERLQFRQEFDLLVLGIDLDPVVAQKLTVLQNRLAPEFNKALFAAWLSALLAREMGLDAVARRDVFKAAILHDVGFLHIDPLILRKQADLTTDEWRAVQAHPIVGKIFAESVNSLGPRVAQAILEHHERCDGLGYPMAKVGPNLEVLGQIVGLADSLQAIRVRGFDKNGRLLTDMKPFLQMNVDVHRRDVYVAACAVLRRAGAVRSGAAKPIKDGNLAQSLLEQWRSLRKIMVFLETLVSTAETLPEGADRDRILLVFRRLDELARQSGLIQEDLGQWLEGLVATPDPEAALELSDMDLMLAELNWQIRHGKRMLGDLFGGDAGVNSPVILALKQMADEIATVLSEARGHNSPAS